MEMFDWTPRVPRPLRFKTFEDLKAYCRDGDVFIIQNGALIRAGKTLPFIKDYRKLTYKKFLEHQIKKRKKKWVR